MMRKRVILYSIQKCLILYSPSPVTNCGVSPNHRCHWISYTANDHAPAGIRGTPFSISVMPFKQVNVLLDFV